MQTVFFLSLFVILVIVIILFFSRTKIQKIQGKCIDGKREIKIIENRKEKITVEPCGIQASHVWNVTESECEGKCNQGATGRITVTKTCSNTGKPGINKCVDKNNVYYHNDQVIEYKNCQMAC